MESKEEEKEDRMELSIQLMKDQRELDTLTGDSKLQQPESLANATELSSTSKAKEEAANDGTNQDDERQAIMKELKNIKRQNFITQCLISAMIVLTLTWQVSEVSLVLKVKDGINHPFKSFKTMLGGVLRGPKWNIDQNGDKKNSTDEHENEGSLVPSFKVPELPHIGLDNDENC